MKKTSRTAKLQNRIDSAVNTARQYGQIDGDHHKMWVIDQMMRDLLGAEEYAKFVKEYEADGDYEWEVGIAP